MTTATTNLTEHGAIAEAIQPYIDGAAKAALRAAEGRVGGLRRQLLSGTFARSPGGGWLYFLGTHESQKEILARSGQVGVNF